MSDVSDYTPTTDEVRAAGGFRPVDRRPGRGRDHAGRAREMERRNDREERPMSETTTTTAARIVNLTPHDVVILDADGSEVHRYPRSGEVARLATVELHSHRMPDDVTVQAVEFHHLAVALPRVEGTRYIVSLPTALAAPRGDFLVPYGEVRDDSGQIRGVRMLAQPV